MSYADIARKLVRLQGVAHSTLMKTPCLRYKGDFFAMELDKVNGLIIKVSPQRVAELISSGVGQEFNFTKKKFKEWVVIPKQFEGQYEPYAREALNYVKHKQDSKH